MSFQVIPDSAMSPIERLPLEILSVIFELYVSTGDALRGCPTTISHVCSPWRELALESPFIWSNITIRLNTATISQKHLSELDHYFKRSDNVPSVPITLTILATRPFQTQEKNELLQPNADRIRCLCIKASEGSVANLQIGRAHV